MSNHGKNKRVVELELSPSRMNEIVRALHGLYADVANMPRQQLTEHAVAHVAIAISLMMQTGAVDAPAEVRSMVGMCESMARVVFVPSPAPATPSKPGAPS